MDWIVYALIAALVLGFFLLNRSTLVPESQAKQWLQSGARIIDVRNPSEYQHKHLPQAVNIPLNELKERMGRDLPDKNQVLLLHCAAGGRSAMARRILKAAGYTKSYNLGSYARAARIAEAAGETNQAGKTG